MLSRKWGSDYKALRDTHQPNIEQVGLVYVSILTCTVTDCYISVDVLS
jgi:hypothetical protein